MLLLGAVGLELLRRLAQRRYPNVEPTSIAASLEQWWASFGTQRTTPSTSADSAREAEHLRPAPLNVADLEALAALHDAGNLTSEEFSTAKQRVLA
jgi:hypothetical protein